MTNEDIFKERTQPSLISESSSSWGNRRKSLGGKFVASVLCAVFVGVYSVSNVASVSSVDSADAISEELLVDSDPVSGATALPQIVALEDGAANLGVSGEQVAAYISRAYRVPALDARRITGWAIEIGESKNIDPLLILAVIGTESSFNPKARSHAGAEGLMQVMTKIHAEQFSAFGGDKAAMEPYPNMVVGTNILAGLIKRTGSVTKGLKWYSGAANHPTDYGYSTRVLRERSRLLVAAKGDSDEAVQLSRRGKTPEGYRDPTLLLKLSFALWKGVAGDAEKNVQQASNAGAAG